LKVVDLIVQELFELLQFEDSEVSKFALQALKDLTEDDYEDECTEQRILVRDSGILPLVFKHLGNDVNELVEYALRVLINIARESDTSLKQSVIELGTLRLL
ncbi:hypothetical protein PMAYCL1PPCAC_14235, partial [Pristionchus mayeri]